MKRHFSSVHRLPLLLVGALLVFIACNLSQDEKAETKISFNKIYDSLAIYDSVRITLKDLSGRTLDIVFEGKVEKPSDIENLSAPHWDGGKAIVSITGYQDDVPVYKVESQFDGATNKKDSVVTFILPGSSIANPSGDLLMPEGDSIPFPPMTISPSTLADKTLSWSSSNPGVVAVGRNGLKAVSPGSARITAKLAADPAKSVVFTIVVETGSKIPDAIYLDQDTLLLAAGGSSGSLSVKAFPASASNAVKWRISDTTIATVAPDGAVSGVKKGEAKLWAASKLKPLLMDSAWVIVSDPVFVGSVRFLKDSVVLFAGGATDSLRVQVLPAKANPAVDFTVSDPGLVGLKNNRITGLAEGLTRVIARSRENPEKQDTLMVRVLPNHPVDSVRVAPKSFKLFVGGEALSLTVKVFPEIAPQNVQLKSGNPGNAMVDESGKVYAVAPGNAKVFAYSLADSTAKDSALINVKTDPPVVRIGEDTVIPVGQTVAFLPVVETQEYGLVTGFKWDLNGDGAWDDSAAAVKTVSYKFDQEKQYLVRFLVKDTEGNQTLVSKKVNAVKGSIVLILSPLNNSYARQAEIAVRWSVDGVEQDSLKAETLKDGPNVITRTVKDAEGRPYSGSVTVILDSVAPAKPQIHGPSLAATATPIWSWATGGAGGDGVFRFALDAEDISKAIETKDTLFTPVTALSEGAHSLFVQERDAAGNWSACGKLAFKVDITAPTKPDVRVIPAGMTNVLKPRFSWNGTGGGIGSFQYKLDNPDFGTAAVATMDTTFTSLTSMANGRHTLYVRERDSSGNWSLPGSASVTIDTVPPAVPKLYGTSPTSVMPKWTWASGGGGSGDFRFRLGDADFASGASETRLLEYSLASATSKGAYNLFVEERDSAGNWSPPANLAIIYDLSKPSVAFTSPQASGTFLTKAATLDIAGTSSSPQGPGSIKAVTYSVDSVAGTLSTNLAPDGSGAWSIKALPLLNNKTIVLRVVATDNIGNKGEASLTISRDNTAPAAPVFTVQPATPLNKLDSRSSLAWTWGAVAGADSFVVKLNGNEVARQVGTTYTTANVVDGVYQLEVSAKDLAGNVSMATTSVNVLVDRVAPDAPTPGASATPTRSTKPTWSWTSNGSGQFEFRVSANVAPTGPGTGISALSYTPNTGLADGTWYFQVREKDGAENWSGWSTSSTVVIKASAPNVPSVFRNGTPTNAPKWTWTSGGGGNGIFQYRWSGNLSLLGSGTSTQYMPDLSEGTYNLCVSERDIVGYGNESCLIIAVDKTEPVIAGYNVADGYITNTSPITISYTKDGAFESFSCDLNDGESTSCSKTVYDAAKNPATVSRTIWYRKNVVFVREGGAGSMNGTSWDDAFGSISSAITSIAGRSGRVEIWVSEGTYSGFLLTRSQTSIYGGFNSSGYPKAIADRELSTTISRIRPDAEGIMVSIRGESPAVCRDAIINGFHIYSEVGQAVGLFNGENDLISDFWVESNRNTAGGAGLVTISNGDAVLNRVFIRDNYSEGYAALYLESGGQVKIDNSEITNNSTGSSWGSGGIHAENGQSAFIRNSKLSRNSGGSGAGYQAFAWGGMTMDIDYCTVQGMRAGIYPTEGPEITWGTHNNP